MNTVTRASVWWPVFFHDCSTFKRRSEMNQLTYIRAPVCDFLRVGVDQGQVIAATPLTALTYYCSI